MKARITRYTALFAVPVLVLAACGSSAGTPSAGATASSSASPGGGTGKIALLLPETSTARYEAADKPFFEAKFAALCPGWTVVYSNANQQAPNQQSQADAAIAQGVKVMVLDPVDSVAAGAIAKSAAAKSIPVISYDRLTTGGSKPDYYVSFDNYQVGVLQATTLLAKLTADGKTNPRVVMINGDPADNNAAQFKAGAHSVLDGKADIVAESDTPNWTPTNAQSEMDGFIARLGKNGFDGLLAANDGTSGGAQAAMTAAGIDPKTIPSTGQDAELAGVQRILLGDQFMTVYKAIKAEADATAELACDLATGTAVPTNMTNGKTVNNETADVPSVLLTPVAVTADGTTAGTVSVEDSVVKDEFYGSDSVAKICDAAVDAALPAACTTYRVP